MRDIERLRQEIVQLYKNNKIDELELNKIISIIDNILQDYSYLYGVDKVFDSIIEKLFDKI